MDRQAVQERFGILGSSPGIHHVIDRLRQVARTDITVLIEGESGTGKELVAHAIHGISMRRHRPIKIINTGAIPEGLIESELFGAEKGAYTGATERRTGLFEEADGGSVFLDEIGEMPAAAQVRLLRVLESGMFNRVGSSKLQRTDTRVIAATNKNLGQEVAARRFREDLYYRLSTVLIRIPPLRERQEDILPILDSFLYTLAQKYNSPKRQLSPEAQRLMLSYNWPGNVRELRNVAEQVVVLHRGKTVDADAVRPFMRGVTSGSSASTALMKVPAKGPTDSSQELALIYGALLDIRLGLRDLRREVHELAHRRERADLSYPSISYKDETPVAYLGKGSDDNQETPVPQVSVEVVPRTGSAPDDEEELPTLEAAERKLILRALRKHGGNRRATAAVLGISPRTLYRKLSDIDVDKS
ncbi:MAG: sigma-54 dependent transcriptional regulator [Bacteroidota bacterium]|nr:sigma-54 dependent transcriptional regulator [Bacteroidota bacterium]